MIPPLPPLILGLSSGSAECGARTWREPETAGLSRVSGRLMTAAVTERGSLIAASPIQSGDSTVD